MRSNLRNEMLPFVASTAKPESVTASMACANQRTIAFALVLLLAAAAARADFDHDEPLPHALASDLAAEVERLESSAETTRHLLAQVDSELDRELEVTTGKLDALQQRVDSLAECCDSPAAVDLPSWLLWLGAIGAALLLALGAWTAFLASRLRKISRRAPDAPNAPKSNQSPSSGDEGRPTAGPARPDAEQPNAITNTEEKSRMAEQETIESRLRFEIRLAQNGEPYFAIVATSNGQVLMKSESYASGMRALQHAMGRVRREAFGATERDRRDEGPIGDASPED